MQETESKQLKKLLELVEYSRGLTLDSCEFEFGDNPKWPQLRSRLLKIFGHRGMEEKIMAIMLGNNDMGGQ